MERRSYISLQLLPERKAIMLATGNSESLTVKGGVQLGEECVLSNGLC